MRDERAARGGWSVRYADGEGDECGIHGVGGGCGWVGGGWWVGGYGSRRVGGGRVMCWCPGWSGERSGGVCGVAGPRSGSGRNIAS